MTIVFIQNIIDLIRTKKIITIIDNPEWIFSHKNTIKVIGDSHCNFFSGNEYIAFRQICPLGINNCYDKNSNFSTFHLGPALAFNLNKYKTKTKAREKVDYLIKHKYLQKNSTVICSFGEIDIRAHVLKQAHKQNTCYKTVVNNIINNYLEFLLFLKSQNFKVFAWGPIPSQKDNENDNPEIPAYGTEKERNIVTEYFNIKLKEVCNKNNIGFLSIFDKLIDKDYLTKKVYIADGCHLSQKAWIFAKDEINKYIELT